jgi:hypothetical protein
VSIPTAVIPVLVTDFVATAGVSVEAFFSIALAASTPAPHKSRIDMRQITGKI